MDADSRGGPWSGERSLSVARLGEVPEPVSDEEFQAAKHAVAWARELHAVAVKGEEMPTQRKRHEELMAQADEAERQESLLRNAAWGTDEVLNDLVSRVTKRLWVENGRLVCDTDRGAEPFGELSPGERWRIALEIAAEQVGKSSARPWRSPSGLGGSRRGFPSRSSSTPRRPLCRAGTG